MATKPLPPVKDDPAIIAASKAHKAYDDDTYRVRVDPTTSPLEQAHRLEKLHADVITQMNKLNQDLHDRRLARAQELQAQLPTGAQIPDDTSPADKAVLMMAFRQAIDIARSADIKTLPAMYREAVRFGDDVTINAIQTIAIEEGKGNILGDVYAHAPDIKDTIEELSTLREQMSGRSIDSGWVRQAFGWVTKPPEIKTIPQLEAAQERAQALVASNSTNLSRRG